MGTSVDLLEQTYAAVGASLTDRDEADFSRPTRAAAWSVRELLYHQLLDTQRALVALASPADPDESADVDELSYWASFRPDQGDGGAAHAHFVQAAAAAYSSPDVLLDQLVETAGAVVRAARAADPGLLVRTQGHVITVGGLVSTLVVEATIHLLDLAVDLPGAPEVPAAVLAHTRRVLEGLAGDLLPLGWDDQECVLKATGRLDLTVTDRDELGASAVLLPVLG